MKSDELSQDLIWYEMQSKQSKPAAMAENNYIQ